MPLKILNFLKLVNHNLQPKINLNNKILNKSQQFLIIFHLFIKIVNQI